MPRIPLKDKLSIGFSSAALVLSFVTLYLNNLRVVSHIKAHIVDIVSHKDPADADDTISTSVTFANTGNREATIESAVYVVRPLGNAEKVPVRAGGAYGLDKVFPLRLEPRQAHDFNLPMPLSALIVNFEKGTVSRNGDTSYFSASMEFQSYDANGEDHCATTPDFVWFRVKKSGLIGFHFQHVSTELLPKKPGVSCGR